MGLFLVYQYFTTAVLGILLLNFITNNILFKNVSNFLTPETLKKPQSLVSVLIPARNEAENIGRCLRSLSKQDYPNMEILVLDDNSEDGTGQVVKNLAKKDPRIKLLKGKPLKKGWLGKNYACHQLSKAAKGEYFVFTDADTLHFNNSISSAVCSLKANGLDALSVYPKQIMVTIHERMVVTFINFAILTLMPLILIKRSKNPLFCTAIGQFLLFKRDVYESIGGHESIAPEILDDVHISKQVKRGGYRFMIFDGSNNIYCRMYSNLSEVVKGFSKFIFAAFNFNIYTLAAVLSFILVLFLFPFILLPLGFFVFEWSGLIINLMILQIFLVFIIKITLSFRFRTRILDVLLHPLSMIYIILIAVNSVFQAKFGQGVAWKGRKYVIGDKDGLKLPKESQE